MKSSLMKQAERFLREQKSYKRWLTVFLCLAVVVILGTTAALKYKGIAVTTDAEMSEEMHTDATVVAEVAKEEIKRHEHEDACYAYACEYLNIEEAAKASEEDGASQEGTEDSADDSAAQGGTETPADNSAAQEPAAGGHTHSDACYTVTGGAETLTCTVEPHTHGDSCYTVNTVSKTVTEDQTDEAGNVTQVEKTVEGTEKVLICTIAEHTHGAECYTVEEGTKTLNCGLQEGAPEAQTAESLIQPLADTTGEVLADGGTNQTEENQTADGTQTEGTPENTETGSAADGATDAAQTTDAAAETGHVHTEECYEKVLICGYEDLLSDEMNLVQSAETENYSVTVTYSESAELDGTELKVVEYGKESPEYIAKCAELDYQPNGLLLIGFYNENGGETEPKMPVSVKVTDKNMTDAVAYDIVHFVNEKEKEYINGNGVEVADGVETEFMVSSFSPFTFTAKEPKWTSTINTALTLFSVEPRDTSGADNTLPEVAPIGGLVHEKKVEPVKGTNEEGKEVVKYYDLTLNVKGTVANTDEKAKLDVVFVMDTSNSMAWNVDANQSGGESRRELANDAITKLIEDFDEEDSGIDAQYKLITFNSYASNNYAANNWQNGDGVKNYLPQGVTGGTNYQDALNKAASALDSSRKDAKTIVIFLTDGAPTYYMDGNRRRGNGSYTEWDEVQGAITGASGIKCDYFFAVGFGAEMTKSDKVGSSGKTAKEILELVADAVQGEGSASATTDLTTYFTAFKESLKRIVAKKVVLTDKLTNEVSIVNEDGTAVETPGASDWTPLITTEDGTELPKDHEEYTKAGMKITYSTDTGLKVEFAQDYVIKENYTYSVTTKIAPNKAAEDKYVANGYMYTEIGDANTGEDSSNRQGIRCNVDGSAKLSYNYTVNKQDKEQEPLEYPYPVVQLIVEKEPPELVDQEMTHDKYIKQVEDDVYDLTLDLTGRVGSTSTAAKYDILFVMDTSGSMDDETITYYKTDTKRELKCTRTEHTHNNGCYGAVGSACEKDVHTHGDSCYESTCEKTVHVHGDSCYETAECTKEPHKHTSACYTWIFVTCGKEEHTHSDECGRRLTCTIEEHTHNNRCPKTLTCTIEEHTHNSNCPKQLTCTIEEHTHNDAECYDVTTVKKKQSGTLLKAAQDAVVDLIDEIDRNANIDAQYNLITFGNPASPAIGWTQNKSTITTQVNSLEADGGTNYHSALVKAGTALKNGRTGDDVTKVVIFLTDGAPTSHLCVGKNGQYGVNNHNLSNDGGSCRYDGEETDKYDYQGALDGAATINSQYFYAIGFGSAMTSENKILTYTVGSGRNQQTIKLTAAELLQNVTKNTNATVKDSTTTTDLQGEIDKIRGNITELRCRNVTVTDTLSQYVEVNDTDTPAKLTVKVTDFTTGVPKVEPKTGTVDDPNGVYVDLPATDKNPASRITATYNRETRQVVLSFPEDYKLESQYKYYVTIQIRPTEAAYKAAETYTDENGVVNYPNEGGAGTDAPDVEEKKWISSGEKGLWTNAGATVTFTYDDGEKKGQEETEEYQRPVIKVKQSKLTISKTVNGLTDKETAKLLANLQFIIDGDTQHPVTAEKLVNITRNEKGKITDYDLKDGVGTANADGSKTYTIVTDKRVVPDTHTVTEKWGTAQVDGYNSTTSYVTKVEGNQKGSGTSAEFDDVSATIELKGEQSGTVEFTNDYKPITVDIHLKKTDGEGNFPEAFSAIKFKVKEGSVGGTGATLTETELKNALDGLTEVAELTLDSEGNAVDAEGKTLHLPKGTYTVIEESPLENYAKVYPFEIKVQENGIVALNPIVGFNNKDNVELDPEPKTAADGEKYYELTVVNRQEKLDELQLLKVSSDRSTITGLANAKFQLFVETKNDEGELVATPIGGVLTTNEDGIIEAEILKEIDADINKTYYLEEVEAPDGYMLATDKIKFTVTVERGPDDGNLVTVTPAEKNRAFIAIPYTTDENGKAVYREYTTEDVQNRNNPYIQVGTKKIWTLAIVNDPGVELPVTGGPGTVAYTFGGIAVIAIGLMYSLSMRRKREKGGLN